MDLGKATVRPGALRTTGGPPARAIRIASAATWTAADPRPSLKMRLVVRGSRHSRSRFSSPGSGALIAWAMTEDKRNDVPDWPVGFHALPRGLATNWAGSSILSKIAHGPSSAALACLPFTFGGRPS